MSLSTISAAAAATREQSRQADGKFGEQAHTEAGACGQLGLSVAHTESVRSLLRDRCRQEKVDFQDDLGRVAGADSLGFTDEEFDLLLHDGEQAAFDEVRGRLAPAVREVASDRLRDWSGEAGVDFDLLPCADQDALTDELIERSGFDAAEMVAGFDREPRQVALPLECDLAGDRLLRTPGEKRKALRSALKKAGIAVTADDAEELDGLVDYGPPTWASTTGLSAVVDLSPSDLRFNRNRRQSWRTIEVAPHSPSLNGEPARPGLMIAVVDEASGRVPAQAELRTGASVRLTSTALESARVLGAFSADQSTSTRTYRNPGAVRTDATGLATSLGDRCPEGVHEALGWAPTADEARKAARSVLASDLHRQSKQLLLEGIFADRSAEEVDGLLEAHTRLEYRKTVRAGTLPRRSTYERDYLRAEKALF